MTRSREKIWDGTHNLESAHPLQHKRQRGLAPARPRINSLLMMGEADQCATDWAHALLNELLGRSPSGALTRVATLSSDAKLTAGAMAAAEFIPYAYGGAFMFCGDDTQGSQPVLWQAMLRLVRFKNLSNPSAGAPERV